MDSADCADGISGRCYDPALWVFSHCRNCGLCSLWRHPIQALAVSLAAARRFGVHVLPLPLGTFVDEIPDALAPDNRRQRTASSPSLHLRRQEAVMIFQRPNRSPEQPALRACVPLSRFTTGIGGCSAHGRSAANYEDTTFIKTRLHESAWEAGCRAPTVTRAFS